MKVKEMYSLDWFLYDLIKIWFIYFSIFKGLRENCGWAWTDSRENSSLWEQIIKGGEYIATTGGWSYILDNGTCVTNINLPTFWYRLQGPGIDSRKPN